MPWKKTHHKQTAWRDNPDQGLRIKPNDVSKWKMANALNRICIPGDNEGLEIWTKISEAVAKNQTKSTFFPKFVD